MNRAEMLQRALERQAPWDMVVVGGGATGAGIAVDAASRGYDVLLLEQHDFGKGTSSRSTKLVHGGVRYLQQGNVPLVMEALHERGLLLQNAPVDDAVLSCYQTESQKKQCGGGIAGATAVAEYINACCKDQLTSKVCGRFCVAVKQNSLAASFFTACSAF